MPQPLLFAEFAEVVNKIEHTSADTEKTHLLASLLTNAGDEIGIAARFSKGEIFPAWDDSVVSIGNARIYDALAAASGQNPDHIEDIVAEVGDVGEVCETLDLSPDSGQVTLFDTSDGLTLSKIYDTFVDISEISGTGSTQAKVDAIKTLLFDASGQEAKYIVRLLLGEMRIGVGDGTVRDAIAQAFDAPVDLVKRGIMVTNDVATVAETARDGTTDDLKSLVIEVGRPVKVMLASKTSKTDSITDANHDGEVACEWKFDGARLETHVDGDDVRLFTRNMNEVTESMPDVCDIVRENVHTNDLIIDAEVVAYEDSTDGPAPFQNVMKRLRRKHDIEETAEEIHLDIHAFDILYADGETLIDHPLRARRNHLQQHVKEAAITDRWYVSTPEEIAAIEEDALEAGHEGVMVKNPASTYKPDNRGKNWLKIKPDVETLDCVVVGGEWGEGRRAKWVGTYMLAVRDEETGNLKEIGKVATGLSDTQLADLTDRFDPLIKSENGKKISFRPEMVFEVGTEEIQPSPQYASGFGLRFPRFIEVREDKDVADADTVQRVESLFAQQ